MLPLAADFPFFNLDILFLLVAGLIALISRIVGTVRTYRKRTAEAERRRQSAEQAHFEDPFGRTGEEQVVGARAGQDVRREERVRTRSVFAGLQDAPTEVPPEPETTAVEPAPPRRLPLRDAPPEVVVRPVPRRPVPAAAPATTRRGRGRRARAGVTRRTLSTLGGDAALVRQAIVLREVLGEPHALRGPWRGRLFPRTIRP